MKNRIKTIVVVMLWFLFPSCEKEVIFPEALSFPYQPEQEIMIDVVVVPLEDVEVDFDAMVKEVNADYFNRYGIGIRAVLGERAYLDQDHKTGNKIFLPQHLKREEKKHFTVYVIPQEYLYFEAAAYSVLQSKSIILGEGYQTNRTLSHELGHNFGLDHVDMTNNVMTPYKRAGQMDKPNIFVEQQIDTMKTFINLNFNYNE